MATKRFTGKDLIGYRVDIKAKNREWAGFWGYVQDYDGRFYHVTGGAIGTACPVFTRDEFSVRTSSRLKRWQNRGEGGS